MGEDSWFPQSRPAPDTECVSRSSRAGHSVTLARFWCNGFLRRLPSPHAQGQRQVDARSRAVTAPRETARRRT